MPPTRSSGCARIAFGAIGFAQTAAPAYLLIYADTDIPSRTASLRRSRKMRQILIPRA